MKYSKLRFRAGNLSAGDIERAVLPTIMFANAVYEGADDKATIHGIGVTAGWWKWGVGFTYTWTNGDRPTEVEE